VALLAAFRTLSGTRFLRASFASRQAKEKCEVRLRKTRGGGQLVIVADGVDNLAPHLLGVDVVGGRRL